MLYSAHLELLCVGFSRVDGRDTVSSLRFFDPDKGLLDSESSQVEFFGGDAALGRPSLGKSGEVVHDLKGMRHSRR